MSDNRKSSFARLREFLGLSGHEGASTSQPIGPANTPRDRALRRIASGEMSPRPMDTMQEKPMSHEEWVASIQKEAAADAKSCRCPVRPWATPGSFASGSAQESKAVDAWTAQHGTHTYAKARDELARALQYAESRLGSGPAVLDMVADVFGLPRGTLVPGSEAK